MGEVRHTTYHHLNLFICISLIINMKKQRKKSMLFNLINNQHTYSNFDIICFIL